MKMNTSFLMIILNHATLLAVCLSTLPIFDHDSTWTLYTNVDDGSKFVELPFFVYFGTSRQTGIYICSNGFMTFESGYVEKRLTTLFPVDRMIISPYWTDILLNSTRGVYYKVLQNDKIVQQINTFLNKSESSLSSVTSALIVKWMNVCPSGNQNCAKGNSFQAVLISDNSTESYAIFTYMCGELNWLSQHPATIGFSADKHFYSNHILSKSKTVNDIACLHQQESIWSNLVYKLSISFLPIINELETPGQLTFVDDDFASVTLDKSLSYGYTHYSNVYVNSNGLVSFDQPYYIDFSPSSFPILAEVVAPYWDDISLEIKGAVLYKAMTSGSVVDKVNKFISSNQSINFNASVVVVAKWVAVCQYSAENCPQPNTFQVVLAEDETFGTYSVYSYKCGLLNWLYYNASIGFSVNENFYANHYLSQTSFVNDIACLNQPAVEWSNVVYHVSREISSDMKVFVNSSITIFCKAFGNPPPSIEWQSSHDLVNESIFEEVHEHHIVTSILRLAVTEDATFNCSAWNNQTNTALKSTSIIVQVPPAILSLEVDEITVIYDQLVKISCLAHGFPIPSVQWKKDGLNVTNVTINNTIIKGNNTIISTLIIHYANYVHSGKYYCSASNDLALLVNEQLMITDVLVIYLADLIDGPTNRTVFEKETLTISCSFRSLPLPTVFWYKDGLKTNKKDVVLSHPSKDILVSTVTIFPVTREDSGIYQCLAEQIINTKLRYYQNSSGIIISVQYSPVVFTKGNQTTLIGYDLEVYCHASANPTPNLQWLRNSSEELPESSRFFLNASHLHQNVTLLLHILNVQESDNGLYTCVATTTIKGREVRSVNYTYIHVESLDSNHLEAFIPSLVCGSILFLALVGIVSVSMAIFRRRCHKASSSNHGQLELMSNDYENQITTTNETKEKQKGIAIDDIPTKENAVYGMCKVQNFNQNWPIKYSSSNAKRDTVDMVIYDTVEESQSQECAYANCAGVQKQSIYQNVRILSEGEEVLYETCN